MGRARIPVEESIWPLEGQPIQGEFFFGPTNVQAPIRPLSSDSTLVAAAAGRLVANNSWRIGTCVCCDGSDDSKLRLISFPNASFFGMAMDNRTSVVTMDKDGKGAHGRAR